MPPCAQLADLLPDLIDKLTPTGKIEAGGLDQLLKMFQGKIENERETLGWGTYNPAFCERFRSPPQRWAAKRATYPPTS